MDEFCDSLEGFQKVYSFQKYIDEWKESLTVRYCTLNNHRGISTILIPS